MKFNLTKSLASISLMVAAACSTTPTVQDYPKTASARDEVAKLNEDMRIAQEAQFEVLAPTNFTKAQESTKDARESLAKQKDDSKTLHLVAEARAHLNRSGEFAKVVQTTMNDVVIARQEAVAAGAPGTLQSEFKKADKWLKKVNADIEDNDTSDAIEDRSDLQLTYRALELQSIKLVKLNAVRNVIALGIKEGAKKFAPRSLAIAEKSLQDTDAYITANRHQAASITEQSEKSMTLANKMLQVTRDAKAGTKVSAEDTALQIDEGKSQIAETQGQLADKSNQLNEKTNEVELGKTTNQALVAANSESQVKIAVGQNTNEALSATNESQKNEIRRGAAANQALASENSEFANEKSLNARFETARKQFTKSEAEVYKQGNTLMIRLRGLEFPSAKADLKGSNFPLLAKVQKVISDFGSSSVIVEGHTDSLGGAAQNEKLSTDRAQAVSSYLSSNLGEQQVEIQAVGFGDQKPLASNKTATGRAQNRRVDVRIQSETAKGASVN